MDDSDELKTLIRTISAMAFIKGPRIIGQPWLEKLKHPLSRKDALTEICCAAAVEPDDQLYDLCIRAFRLIEPGISIDGTIR